MAKPLTFANVILCEYVGSGSGNKYTLVNTYSGDVVVVSFPAAMHFGLFAEYIPSKAGAQRIVLEIKVDGEKYAELKIDAMIDDVSAPACLIIQALQMNLDREIRLEVFATSEGYAQTKILSKRVFAGKVPGLT